MKKSFVLLSLLLFVACISVNAQDKGMVSVTLKNGTQITGIVKSFNPATSITIEVAGFPTTIKMSDVDKVEQSSGKNEVAASSTETTAKKSDPKISEKVDVSKGERPTSSNPLIVKDDADYPESVKVKIGNREFEFILIRGGSFLMGYDGRGSLAMKSEPIHLVHLTSFYMCTKLLSDGFVKELNIRGIDPRYQEDPFVENERDELLKIVRECNALSQYNFRLPTEAEWEYAARGQVKDKLFLGSSTAEACSDYYDDYEEYEATDPTGPMSGRKYVVRHPYYFGQYLPYNRSLSKGGAGFGPPVDNAAIRLTIKAKDFIK